MKKHQSDSARTWAAKLDRIEGKVIEGVETTGHLTDPLSMKLHRIETSSRVSMGNSVHSAMSLDSISSMVSQIHSTVSKWNSVISSGHRELPSSKIGSPASSEKDIGAAVVATEKEKDRSATYRCYFPCCYRGEISTFDHLRSHLALIHGDIEPELSSLLEHLSVQSIILYQFT